MQIWYLFRYPYLGEQCVLVHGISFTMRSHLRYIIISFVNLVMGNWQRFWLHSKDWTTLSYSWHLNYFLLLIIWRYWWRFKLHWLLLAMPLCVLLPSAYTNHRATRRMYEDLIGTIILVSCKYWIWGIFSLISLLSFCKILFSLFWFSFLHCSVFLSDFNGKALFLYQ